MAALVQQDPVNAIWQNDLEIIRANVTRLEEGLSSLIQQLYPFHATCPFAAENLWNRHVRSHAPHAALADLTAALGAKISTNPSVCLTHGSDESSHAPKAADAVLFAETAEDIQRAVAICQTHGLPIIPFGAGSSLEGHVIPGAKGALSIDTSKMDQILEVNAEDLDCRVQAGVTREALNEHLRDQGLFFPIDPGAHASLGGMAATRASGTNAVRYGTMKDVVLGVTAVMPNGEILRHGTRALKSSAGYDLTRLLVGSEGTLGLITELQLKLFGIPEAMSAAVCPFHRWRLRPTRPLW